MIRILSLFILLQVFSPLAYAGMIYGELTADIDEKGVAVLKVICGEKEYEIGKVVIGDSYSVEVVEKGACTLQVNYNEKTIGISVTFFDSPEENDLYIKKKEDGTYSLEIK